jgi:hypothetical protein
MAGEIEAAWIAAGASIVVAAVSLVVSIRTSRLADRTQAAQDATARSLAELTSRLSRENDAAKAKQDYEYEARKRLYAELYPLAYQLHTSSVSALHCITNLALAARIGHLAAGKDNWLTGLDPYYFTSVLHTLIAPLAVHELMTRKLTDLDLRLDRDLNLLQLLSRKAYGAMRSDFDLIDPRYPKIAFGPGIEGYAPPEIRPADPPDDLSQRWAWRQGLYSGQISEAVDAILKIEDKTARVMSYAEFAKALGGADLRSQDDPGGAASAIWRSLRPLSSILRDFHPARRPITWRMLLAQGACYRAIAAAQAGVAKPAEILKAARFAEAKDRAEFDWIGDGARSIPPALKGVIDFPAERDSAFAAADLFLQQAFTGFAELYGAR